LLIAPFQLYANSHFRENLAMVIIDHCWTNADWFPVIVREPINPSGAAWLITPLNAKW